MLTAITIKNFTLVEQLEIDFCQGMTAITGETGAGKSLVLGALSMALGDRADTDRIRRGAERAEVSALFDISSITPASQWLIDQDFENTGSECLLRRIITREGRSRGSINGQPATMAQLRELGEMLIDIHNQHEHQSLLRRDTHRAILDNYADTAILANEVKQLYQSWRSLSNHLTRLENQSEELDARKELLVFQVNELDQLELSDNELAELEQEQHLLANAESIIQKSHQVLDICSQAENFNLQTGLHRTLQLLQEIPQKADALASAEKLLISAEIEIEEASREIQHYLDSFEVNPEQLQQVEERLSAIFQLARKHRVPANELCEKHRLLQQELDRLNGGTEDIAALQNQLAKLKDDYLDKARQLTKKRTKAALSLSDAVSGHFDSLAMQGALFTPQLAPLPEGEFASEGLEAVEFLIATNPGDPPRPLQKIASGGELSRISLAIQVIAAQNSAIPTLVFDEVDVGIGGATADVVGKMLRQLGSRGQVICVTHQPQVAACAHQHLLVSKRTHSEGAESGLTMLPRAERVNEIARMLGGAKVTGRTVEHAREMLELAES
ncbi:MAG: DNA repair protein RecN [Pseudomonadales bacterium]|nr:DNA repair protein RecN [Pseudomonadales bacterium]